MARTIKPPEFINKLKAAITVQMPGCEFELERLLPTNRFRLIVVWDGFAKSNAFRRQDRIWKIASKVLSGEEMLRVSMILTVRPDELQLVNDLPSSRQAR